jgi:formylglycine-generating enzyme required for sulfatase activity/tRNA A-37 threonylcarbamoyl transferase component Bud32
VEGKLGSGGFAVVYLVRDVNLKRKLAVKVLSPDVISSHSVLERFKREAETIAQLSHPHIVPLHFIGNKDDLVYIVMQAVDGGSLSERLEKEKRFPIEDASRYFSEVASALAHAHKRGVVHRDIKPQNVLLDAESGRSMVTDFGIARTAEGASLTATGMVVGTPTYLSPEQVTGEPSDHRADIYALGVMAYEMLAGVAPFTGATPTAVLMKRLAGPPAPLQSVRAEVPDVLAELVDACLATDPNERLSNAGDITRALTGASPVSGGHTTSSRIRVTKEKAKAEKGKRSWGLIIGVTAPLVLAAFVFGVYKAGGMGRRVPPPPIDAGMAMIQAGVYTIGNNDEEVAKPSRLENVTAFGIDKHEVTIAEYAKWVTESAKPWKEAPVDSLIPVTGVRLAEAQNYCAWRHPVGGRLPTEVEWEAAARGFEGRLYAWGREWSAKAANVANVLGKPARVGSYPLGRTPEGVDDMIGNVWEWTSSEFRPYGNTSAKSTGQYVLRGGGFSAERRIATATWRIPYDPQTDRENLAGSGFRCVMPVRAVR